MLKFRLRLLGYPALTASDGSHVTGLGPGKPLAMLAYLAVRGEARREELVDLLWGEVSEANARNAFRQALHRLRTALGEEILPMDRDKVDLNAAAGLDTDRQTFVEALDRGEISLAIEAYRGDFLEGFSLGEPVFDGWVDAERTRLKGRFQLALQNGAESALAAGRWLEALQYVQRLTAVAPYDEAAALLEANVLVAAGRGSEALQSLRRHAQNLRDQLDLQPSPKVRDMISRIERVDGSRDVAPSPRVKEAPFVGREHEIATLMSFVRGMASERGATVLIEGEAGLGKSRLVTEFLGRTRSLGPLLVLRGRERPTSAALPYASIAEALRAALRAPGVAGTGRHLLSEAARILPELRDSFDLPEPPPIDAEGGRLRFFEGIAALLDSAAYEQPVCVVLDDLQHASASTADLIGYLAARLQTSPVLIVLISRQVERDSALWRIVERDGSDEPGSRVIPLGPLDREAVRTLVEHIVGGAADAGPVDIDRVTEAAAGNPLRAIELGRRALNGELPSAAPASLRDILWARLQKASPSQRRVFFAAALLPRRSSLRLLAAAAHLPELATFEAAQDLEQLGLLGQEGDSYVIAHDFTASFVAETSGLAGRALLAGWAADALAAEPGQSSAELANLYALAGQQASAFTHARRAVYAAAALGSPPEVHRLLGFALAIAPDQKSRVEAESMMAAFGSGQRLLEATVDNVPTAAEKAAAPSTAAPVEPASPAPKTKSAAAVVPRRQLITPRLVSLIIIGVLATTLAFGWRRSISQSNGLRSLRDSLLVVERGNTADNVLVITGPIASAAERRFGILPRSDLPVWSKTPALPWIRPLASRNGHVAMERMTNAGTDVYVFTGPGADPIPVAIGGGIDAIMGWSPDGSSLLVRRSKALPDGAFDADLWAFRVAANRQVVGEPIDTSPTRSVEEASWSPDGSRIAWVAQTGPTHQRDVFVSLADGSAVEDVTSNPGEDFHISWSSNGSLLAFTSDRDGNPDLFAVELEGRSRRIWRLTNTPAAEDFASFSPDSRFVAFQSTAGGDAAVYVMAALGGTPTRITPEGAQFSIAGWRGEPPISFIDRFRIIGPGSAAIGDSIRISLFGADQNGKTQLPDSLTLAVTGPGAPIVRLTPPAAHTFIVTPLRAGPLTMIATIPGWRADTLTVDVGQESRGLSDDFSAGIAGDRWLALGSPRPSADRDSVGPAMFPNADVEWPSGLLSRSFISLRDTVDLSVTLRAPFALRPAAGAQLHVSLVAATPGVVDSVAPQFQDYVGVIWDGETSRFTYSVGPESKSDPASSLLNRPFHRVRIVITRSANVLFFVDSQLRWSSSLRFLGGPGEQRARLWIGGRATGTHASIDDVVLKSR